MSESSLALSSLYNRLFTFGSLQRVAALYIIFYTLYTAVLYALLGIRLPLLIASLIPLTYLLIDLMFFRFFGNRDAEIFDIRRTLGKYLFILPVSSASISAYLLIAFLLGFAIQEYVVLGVVLASTVFIDSSVMYPMLESGTKKSIFLSTVKILMTSLSAMTWGASPSSLLYITISSVSAFVIPQILYMYIDRVGGRVLGASPFGFLRAYISTWLLDDPEDLEQQLKKNALQYKVKAYSIVFPESPDLPTGIIIPYIHYGPFKNVGSSDFPYQAASYFYMNKSMNTAVVHTPTTHELDLASREDVYVLLNAIAKFRNPSICGKISNIISVEKNSARALGIRLCDYVIIFLEYLEMEDIPSKVAVEIDKYARDRGFKAAIVVDCHNSLSRKDYILPAEAVDELIDVGLEAVDILKREDQHLFKVGFAKCIPEGVSRYSGLGSNGISVLYFETLVEKNAIIIIDSNNLDRTLKQRLESLIESMGIYNYVILTTDTHEVAALELVPGGYRILGEDPAISEKVVEALSQCIGEAMEKSVKSEAHIYFEEASVKILGYNLLDKLSKVSLWASNLFRKWFVMGYVLTVFISILLPHIIYLKSFV